MILACPSCGASHAMPASKIPGLTELCCRRCRTSFSVEAASSGSRDLAPQSDQHPLISDLAPEGAPVERASPELEHSPADPPEAQPGSAAEAPSAPPASWAPSSSPSAEETGSGRSADSSDPEVADADPREAPVPGITLEVEAGPAAEAPPRPAEGLRLVSRLEAESEGVEWSADLPAPRAASWPEESDEDEGIDAALAGAEQGPEGPTALEPTVAGGRVPERLRSSASGPRGLALPTSSTEAEAGPANEDAGSRSGSGAPPELAVPVPLLKSSPDPERSASGAGSGAPKRRSASSIRGAPIRQDRGAAPGGSGRPRDATAAAAELEPGGERGEAARPDVKPILLGSRDARERGPSKPPARPRVITADLGARRPGAVLLDPDLPPEARPAGPHRAPSRGPMVAALAAIGVGVVAVALFASRPPPPAPPPVRSQAAEVEPPRRSAAPPGPVLEAPPPRRTAYLRRPARLHASIRGPRVGRLEAGAEVERLDAHDGWVLVLAGPSGPVGFVEADHLAAEKPLVTLAAEKAFSDCERGPGCLSSARRQRLRCEEACDGQAGAAREKCRAACGMAFETCRSACGSRP